MFAALIDTALVNKAVELASSLAISGSASYLACSNTCPPCTPNLTCESPVLNYTPVLQCDCAGARSDEAGFGPTFILRGLIAALAFVIPLVFVCGAGLGFCVARLFSGWTRTKAAPVKNEIPTAASPQGHSPVKQQQVETSPKPLEDESQAEVARAQLREVLSRRVR